MKTENDVGGQLAALYEPHTVGTKIVGAASVGDPSARHQMPVAENPLKVPALKDPVADAVVAVPEGWESTGPERMKHDQPQWVKVSGPQNSSRGPLTIRGQSRYPIVAQATGVPRAR